MARLSTAEWQKIRDEYITTNITYRGIQKKYGVSLNTIKKKSAEESWIELRAENSHPGTQKVIQESVCAFSLLDSNCQTILEKIEEGLRTHTAEELTPSVLKLYTSTMKDVKDIVGYKSKIDLDEQRARIAKLRKEVEEDNTDQSVTVVIKGADDYCD